MESFDQEPPRSDGSDISPVRAAGGTDELLEALMRLRAELVRGAGRLIRSLGADENDLDGAGAVDMAFFELWQSEVCHGDCLSWKDDALVKRAWGTVRRIVFRQKQQSLSIRRGGERRTGNARGARRIAANVDVFVSPESPVEEVINAKLELEALMERLPQPLRTFLDMHNQDCSINEIAGALDLDRKTVAQRRKEIAAIYRKLDTCQ